MALIAKMPKWKLCPEGAHKANVAKVELRHHEQWGERVRYTFELAEEMVQDDGSPTRVFCECSNTLTPKSKLRQIFETLTGHKLSNEQAMEGVDVEGLVGLPCTVIVKHQESQNGNTYARVETVLKAE